MYIYSNWETAVSVPLFHMWYTYIVTEKLLWVYLVHRPSTAGACDCSSLGVPFNNVTSILVEIQGWCTYHKNDYHSRFVFVWWMFHLATDLETADFVQHQLSLSVFNYRFLTLILSGCRQQMRNTCILGRKRTLRIVHEGTWMRSGDVKVWRWMRR